MHSIELVQQFHESFGHPVAEAPNLGTPELRLLRVKLIAEELTELCAALGVGLRIDFNPFMQDVHAEIIPDWPLDLVEAADALGDLDYVVQGANLVFGFPAEAIIDEIHSSNMSKLGADGKPIYREDGKILKGPNYFKPNIAQFLNGPTRRHLLRR